LRHAHLAVGPGPAPARWPGRARSGMRISAPLEGYLASRTATAGPVMATSTQSDVSVLRPALLPVQTAPDFTASPVLRFAALRSRRSWPVLVTLPGAWDRGDDRDGIPPSLAEHAAERELAAQIDGPWTSRWYWRDYLQRQISHTMR